VSEPSSVPAVETKTMRFEDDVWAAVIQECERRGLRSGAEYVRQAVVAQLAFDRAVRAAREGPGIEPPSEIEQFALMLLRSASRR
jgi:hypothetical protein